MVGTYQGTPCKHGHSGLRYRSGKRDCVDCKKDGSKRRAATPEGREKKRLAYWKEGGKEDRRARNLKQNYGLTTEQYNAMALAQDFRCGICGNGEQRGLRVDHCHNTRQVRGLLCTLCNIGLGAFKDDPVRLGQAIGYLRAHEADHG